MSVFGLIAMAIVIVALISFLFAFFNDLSGGAIFGTVVLTCMVAMLLIIIGWRGGAVENSCPLVSGPYDGLYVNQPYTTVGKYKVKDVWYFHAEDTSGWARCVRSKDEPPARFFLKADRLQPL